MQTLVKIFFYIFLVVLFCSCKKESDILVKTPKKIRPFEFNGYVISEPLEQYFDGVKVRDLYGKIQLQYPAESSLAFMNDQTEMELKRKGTGEVVYKQTFKASDENSKVPLFYFDGKWKNRFEYPDVTGTDFLVNFYFDAPDDSAAADVYMTVVEYWLDWDDTNNPQKILKLHDIPLAQNVKKGWTTFRKLDKLPDLPKIRPESEFWPQATIKKAGTNEYYVRNDLNYSGFNLQVPQGWESQGMVQSIYFNFTELGNIVFNDLVPMYPK